MVLLAYLLGHLAYLAFLVEHLAFLAYLVEELVAFLSVVAYLLVDLAFLPYVVAPDSVGRDSCYLDGVISADILLFVGDVVVCLDLYNFLYRFG